MRRVNGPPTRPLTSRPAGQVMAETVYERVTGRPADGPVPVAVSLVIADTTLAGDDDELGWLDGYGPVPAGFCRRVDRRRGR